MRLRVHAASLLILASLILTACGAGSSGAISAVRVGKLGRWVARASVRRVLDLSRPRRDRAIIVAAAGRLALLAFRATRAQPFATGASGYSSPGGEEPYIARSAGTRTRGVGCTFGKDALYALRLAKGTGVTVITAGGRAERFARIDGQGLESGIAFDDTGRFGHRLLLTRTSGSNTTVFAVDCRGAVTTITNDGPRVEGGIAVAPATFGRFGGDLIAADEYSGRIYAIGPHGHSAVVADSGLPHGADVGVESAGFVPAGFGGHDMALVADRLTPGNPHPGDDFVLGLGARSLRAAGVHPGDLLVSSEGGALTDAINCTNTCRVRYVASGPSVAHVEGHIVFTTGAPSGPTAPR
jgi:hypothetical protein